jgi:hypothetical protein
MNVPASFMPLKRRAHRKRRSMPVASPTLTLLQATYPVEGVVGAIDLKFDRAIDIGALDGTRSIVKDGIILGFVNDVEFAELLDEQTVRMYLAGLEDYSEPNQLLSASATSGIVAVDDGGTWPGVTDLVLPWPASQIVSVTHGELDTDRVVASVNQQMSTIDDPATAFEVSVDGVTWLQPMSMSLDVMSVAFIFMGDVSDVTQWRVQHPENWHFADGIPLTAPLSGTIE